jgi:hypothetical protein
MKSHTFIWVVLALCSTGAKAGVVVESSDPDIYFGTATLLAPGGSVLFSQNYLFVTQSIGQGLAEQIQADSALAAFAIVQNNILQAATLDDNQYLIKIFNTYSGGTSNGHAEPFYDPNNTLAFFAASDQLSTALKNLPVPFGTMVQTLLDTGNVQQPGDQYIVVGPTPGGPDFAIQASIALRLFEHDFTAVAVPVSTPEPSEWILISSGIALALLRSKLNWRLKRLPSPTASAMVRHHQGSLFIPAGVASGDIA